MVVDAVRDFIAWKKREGAKKNYLDKMRWRLGITVLKDGTERIKEGSFASVNKFLNDVAVDELDEFIWGETWDVTNSTRRDFWKTLSTFYDWACEKKPRRCDRNPIKQIAKPPANELDPEAFTVEQAKTIMETAAKCFNGELVPYFAIALFGGLRPQEIQGNDTLKPLTWNPDNIVWDKDDEGKDKVSIRLRGKQAWRRTVLLPDNCVAWIRPYKKAEGPVCPGNFLKKFDVIRCAAGFRVGKGRIHGIDKKGIDGLDDPYSTDLPEWIQDGCRHSALSYRLAIVEDVNAVCSWAGNSPRTFKGNYEALVTKEQAKKYWNILPPGYNFSVGETWAVGLRNQPGDDEPWNDYMADTVGDDVPEVDEDEWGNDVYYFENDEDVFPG